MASAFIERYRLHLIVATLLIFVLFSLWLKSFQSAGMIDGGIVRLFENDPWYNMRQIEVMVHNFPQYNWFDPMTAYPAGKLIDWGPLFPLIAASFCLVTGAATRPDIMYMASWVPVLMGIVMIPVMYMLGRVLCDWKTGLVAAGMISILSGEYFYRSSFGFVDHHIAEVLFSTLFFLVYISALRYTQRHTVQLNNVNSMKIPVILSLAGGVIFLAGLFVMPTFILFALIIAIYTLVQYLWDFYHARTSEYLLIINTVTFALVTVIYALFFQKNGSQFFQYSLALEYAFLLLIGGTIILQVLSTRLKGNRWYFPVSIAAVAAILIAIIAIFAPALYSTMASNFWTFFGVSSQVTPIIELEAWSIARAWSSFNFGLILMVGGLAALVLLVIRKHRTDHLFVLVWSIVILVATILHVRYEYLTAVVVALASAFAVGFVLDYAGKHGVPGIGGASNRSPGEENAEGKKKKQKFSGKRKEDRSPGRGAKAAAEKAKGFFYLTCTALLLFAIVSVYGDYQSGQDTGTAVIPDNWVDVLGWMNDHTPDPAVNYFGTYDKATWKYPPQSYGVMSWWDYGHWITFLAKRIPNSNPFQDNVRGRNSSSSFFLGETEESATGIAQALGSRFIITDYKMADTKFQGIVAWSNGSRVEGYYTKTFLAPSPQSPGRYNTVTPLDQHYYLTMVSRLQHLDGSMTEPGKVYYVEYSDKGTLFPVIGTIQIMDAASAIGKAEQFNRNATPGTHATVAGDDFTAPPERVPALRQYRLVYESTSGQANGNASSENSVKVFERVKGAHISGEGILELPLVTNEGRKFVYRQQSENGEFIVPYSTSGNPYGVTAQGKYNLQGSTRDFEVSEEDVIQGKTIP
jgi:oligosaccharyl transferase (archaeosortase A-associated)